MKVDFSYSGKLPDGTKVTIKLPEEGTIYKEGTKLYFYYYNLERKEYEYASESIVQNKEVTFSINHCSEYLITSEKLVQVDIIEKKPDVLYIIGAGIGVLAIIGLVIGVVLSKKRKK